MFQHHLSSALRSFWRFRFMTVVNLLGLSLGLLCFIAAFATIRFLTTGDETLPNIDRVYAITQQMFVNGHSQPATGRLPATSDPVARYMRQDYPDLEGAARVSFGSSDVSTQIGGAKQYVPVSFVDHDFGKVFDLPLTYGDSKTAFLKPRSAVITAETALRLFGTSNPVGRTLHMRSVDVTITGVLPKLPQPSLFGNGDSNIVAGDLLVTADVDEADQPKLPEDLQWQSISRMTLVKLKPGVSIGAFDQELKDFGTRHVPKRIHAEFGTIPVGSETLAYIDALMRSDQTGISMAFILGLLGTIVLAIASLNYSNLAVAQASCRIREVGTRRILGASLSHILIQQILEGLLLSGAALILVLVGLALATPLAASAGNIDLTRLLFSDPNFWIILVLGVGVISLAAGFYPAWMLTRMPVISAIQGGKTPRSSRVLSFALVLLQFSSASLLLISVLCMGEQNAAMRRMQVPLSQGTLIAAETSLLDAKINLDELRNLLRGDPRILSVSAAASKPWDGEMSDETLLKQPSDTAQVFDTFRNEVDYDYFTTIGATLLAGRDFSREQGSDLFPEQQLMESGSTTPEANIVIDRSTAAEFGWTPRQAVGQTIYKERREPGHFQPMHIIGVIADQPLHLSGMGAFGNDYTLEPKEVRTALIRVAPGSLPSVLQTIDKAWTKLSPDVPLQREFNDVLFEKAVTTFDRVTSMVMGLSIVAFLIALMGLFGMATQVALRRRHEIGIRKSLGASIRQILTLLLWDFSKPIIIANVIAWPLAFVAMRVYLNLFVERIALTPVPFILSLVATVAIAWAAVGWQAIRAARLDPALVLRYE